MVSSPSFTQMDNLQIVCMSSYKFTVRHIILLLHVDSLQKNSGVGLEKIQCLQIYASCVSSSVDIWYSDQCYFTWSWEMSPTVCLAPSLGFVLRRDTGPARPWRGHFAGASACTSCIVGTYSYSTGGCLDLHAQQWWCACFVHEFGRANWVMNGN